MGTKAAKKLRCDDDALQNASKRTAAALEARNLLQKERNLIKIILARPDSAAAKEWLDLQAEEALRELKQLKRSQGPPELITTSTTSDEEVDTSSLTEPETGDAEPDPVDVDLTPEPDPVDVDLTPEPQPVHVNLTAV